MKFYISRSFGDICQRSFVSCLPIFPKEFFDDTPWPISIKFHNAPLGFQFGSSHLTKKADMPI